jgi:hypothetical protein
MSDVHYPATLTCVVRKDFSLKIEAGLRKTEFDNGQTRIRRRFKFTTVMADLKFVVSTAKLFDWQLWINRFGYNWFLIGLQSHLSVGKDGETVDHRIRIVDDLKVKALTDRHVEITTTAEFDPAYYPLVLPDAGENWIVARSPVNPAPDWVDPRDVTNPAEDSIVAGQVSNITP